MGARSNTAVAKWRIARPSCRATLRAMASAFKYTSGPITAEPKFSSTPPSRRSTARAKIRKSRVAGRSQRRAVAVGVLVDDVVADARVYRGRHAAPVRRGKERKLAVREIAGFDAAADVLAQPQLLRRRLPDPFVQLAGFAPEPELAGADVAVHALGGGADAGQFVIVDGARAVEGQVIDPAVLHQIDDVPAHPRAQHVRAHHEDARRAGFARPAQPVRHGCQVRMGERRRRFLQSQPLRSLQIVRSVGQRLQLKPRAVKQLVSGHGPIQMVTDGVRNRRIPRLCTMGCPILRAATRCTRYLRPGSYSRTPGSRKHRPGLPADPRGPG